MKLKIGMYLLSLWLLFIFVIGITGKFPFTNWEFIGVKAMLKSNVVPLLCLVLLAIGMLGYRYFQFQIKGSHETPFQIKKIETINYEHLTFLATYIIPLISIDFEKVHAPYVFFGLIGVMGWIYIKTDLFYANPSLALLGFQLYKVNGAFKGGQCRENIILICQKKLVEGQYVTYVRLDERIYYVKGV